MQNYIYNKIWAIYCSFVVGIVLQCLCLFLKTYFCLQPSWITMLLIYWIVICPKKINIGTGFVLGIITDCIFGSTLGVHALSLSILSYLTIQKIYFFRYFDIWQQSIGIVFLSITNQSIKLLIKFLITKILYSPEIFWSCILDGIIWPFLILVMRKIYQY